MEYIQYQKLSTKQKMYKDYLAEYKKKCKEQGIDEYGDHLIDYKISK